MSGRRLARAAATAIDRSRPLRFTFDGVALPGFAGDTLASALLAERRATSSRGHLPRPAARGRGRRRRGAERARPGRRPTARSRCSGRPDVELVDGLVAASLAARARCAAREPHGRASTSATRPLRRAGGRRRPAGRAAARGRGADRRPGDPGRARRSTRRTSTPSGELRVLPGTTALGIHDHGYVTSSSAARPRGPRAGCGTSVRGRIVLRPARTERPIVFADDDRPGDHARRRRRGVRRALRRRARASAPCLHEQRRARRAPTVRPSGGRRDRRRGRRPRRDRVVDGATATAGASTRSRRRRSTAGAIRRCDLLAVSGGWNPALQLWTPGAGRRSASTSGSPRSSPDRRGPGRPHAGRRAPPPATSTAPAARAAVVVLAAAATAGRLGPPLRRPAARRDRRRPAPAPSAPACARSSTSSATRRSARPPTRARRRGVVALGDPRRRCSASRSAPLGPDDVPAAVRPGHLRAARRARSRRAARPGPDDARSSRGTSRTARCSRTSASGSGRGTSRAPASRWTTPSCASARRRATGVGGDGRLDARQDRRPGPGRRRSSSTASTPTVLDAQGRRRAATA